MKYKTRFEGALLQEIDHAVLAARASCARMPTVEKAIEVAEAVKLGIDEHLQVLRDRKAAAGEKGWLDKDAKKRLAEAKKKAEKEAAAAEKARLEAEAAAEAEEAEALENLRGVGGLPARVPLDQDGKVTIPVEDVIQMTFEASSISAVTWNALSEADRAARVEGKIVDLRERHRIGELELEAEKTEAEKTEAEKTEAEKTEADEKGGKEDS